VLAREARRLNRDAGAGSLPFLLAFTDPVRTPDPLALAARLPRGAGLVYRHFGAADRFEAAANLARLCRARGLKLLIGGDPELARAVKADGVHWPEARLPAYRLGFALETAAAHGPRALRRARAVGMDAAVLSPVFASASPSAGAALGARRAGLWARQAGLPVYALGGVHARTAAALRGRGFAGAAAIEALLA